MIKINCSYDELVPIEQLTPNRFNPNHHPDSQIKALAEVIRKTGWRAPIVAGKKSGLINIGHGRYQAAKLLGVTEVPVDWQEFNNEAEEYSAMIADNKLAEESYIDEDELREVMKAVQDMDVDFDLALTGFNTDEIADLFRAEIQKQAKELEQTPEAEESSSDAAPNPYAGMKESSVRMVQVYFDDTNIDEYRRLVKEFKTKHGIDNDSDAILKAFQLLA